MKTTKTMKKTTTLFRAAAVVTAAATGILAVTAAAQATSGASASPGPQSSNNSHNSHESQSSSADGGFGYTDVRRGIPDSAVRFAVASPQVHNGGAFPVSAWASSFGCTGGNQQITLDWHGAPSAARSFAVTMFDPDAPTGSGFWHWLVWDIPAGDTELSGALPAGAVAGTDDAGVTGYLGPCPPAGDGTHHYEITVYALNVASLNLPSATPAALATFSMSSHVIGYAEMTVDAKR